MKRYEELLNELEPISREIAQNIDNFYFSVQKNKKKKEKDENETIAEFYDYGALLNTCESLSREIVKKYTDYYFQEHEEFLKTEFFSKRAEVDSIIVSKILFQLKTAERAIIKILEIIDGGNINSRYFDSLSNLQKSYLETIRYFLQIINILEMNYKNLNYELNEIKKLDSNKNEIKLIKENNLSEDNDFYTIEDEYTDIRTYKTALEKVLEKRDKLNNEE